MHSRDVPPNGQLAEEIVRRAWAEGRYWFAGVVGLALLVLLVRALTAPTPPFMDTPTAVVATPAPAPPAMRLVAPATELPAQGGMAPTATAVAPALLATAAGSTIPVAGCPPARILREGERAGWLARAAGCPQAVLANIRGAHQWVQRPADLSDELYGQLPEVQP